MEYNTTTKKLILPEYGRNVQNMAEHLLAMEDREKRTKAAHELVTIMTNMNPDVKETKDHKQKIWDFLAQICEYKLDVDFPFEISKMEEAKSVEKLPYNTSSGIRYRHYGRMVEKLIATACEIEDGPSKDELVKIIANHMKKTYVAWNQKDVADVIIINDLYEISKGKLKLDIDTKLMSVSSSSNTNNNNQNNNNKKKKKTNNNNYKNNNNKKRK